MKISKKWSIATIAVIWIPCLIGILLWGQLPQQVPTHWNIHNEIDGWSPKWMLVFGMPAFMTVMQIFALFMYQNDPKKKNISKKLMGLMSWFIPAMTLVMVLLSYGAAMGLSVDMGMAVSIFIGLLMIGMGNYLPKSRQSYTMGVKLPWTLNSEENWNRTNRLAGWLWAVGGVLLILNGIFTVSPYMVFVILIVISGVPAAYSYFLYRKGI
ncbi:MAG: SdpI family protein [Lachnospiraceae bacterium]